MTGFGPVKKSLVGGFVGGWINVCKSHFKDCLQQSEMIKKDSFELNNLFGIQIVGHSLHFGRGGRSVGL